MSSSHAPLLFENLIEDVFFLICLKLIPEDIDALTQVARATHASIMSEKANHVLWKPKYELHQDIPPSTLPIKNYRQRLIFYLKRVPVSVVGADTLPRSGRIFSIAIEGDIESVCLMLRHPKDHLRVSGLLLNRSRVFKTPLHFARKRHQSAWLDFCYRYIFKPQGGSGFSLRMAVETLQPMGEIKELIKDNPSLVATERFDNFFLGVGPGTLAHLAAWCGHAEFLQYVYENHPALFEKHTSDLTLKHCTVLDFAIGPDYMNYDPGCMGYRGRSQVLQLLFDWKKKFTYYPKELLTRAALSGNLESVKVVLTAKPALLTKLDRDGKSTVDHIIGFPQLRDIIMHLLRAGSPYRRHIAVETMLEDPTFASEILEFDPGLLKLRRGIEGDTLLHQYCIFFCLSFYPPGHDERRIYHDYDIILSTSWAKSLIHTTNHAGRTPFEVAVSLNAPTFFLKKLISIGANPNFNPVTVIRSGHIEKTEVLHHIFLQRIGESHKEINDILWKLFLYTRDRYADSREKQVPQIFGYYCFWPIGGYTRTQKLAAVAALFDVLLDGADVSRLTPHLKVLSDGKLGKIFNLPELQFYLAKKTGLDSSVVEIQHHSPQMRLTG